MHNLLAKNRRFTLVVIAFVLCFSAVAARLAWLQIFVSEKYIKDAEAKTHAREIDVAARGQITDCRGEVLAYNQACWDIGVDPHELADGDEALIPQIAKLLELPEAEVRQKYAQKERRWVVLKKGVSPEVRQAILDLQPRRVKLRGQTVRRVFKPVYGEERFMRNYPKGDLAAQIIGYINKEGVPAMGIEMTMDGFLRGENGWVEIMHDRRGRELVYRRSREVPARDGNTVELTIDARIQAFAEAQCARLAREYNPKASCVIVSEAGSGRLLALANWPTFNLNEFYDAQKAPDSHKRNRAVTELYDPGSVFKTFVAAMSLEKKLVTPNSRFDCTKTQVPYRGRMSFRLPKDDHPLGDSETLRNIVVKSSNRGFAQLGMRFAERFGEAAFYENVLKFGFGKRTNLLSIGAKAESPGRVLSPSQWDRATITRMPIGHAISVTPLQTHNAMNVIASRGQFWEPLIVSRVLDEKGRTVVEYLPRSRGRVVSREVAATVADMLKDVCDPAAGGTARRAYIPGYEIAGKTGTSRKYINGRSSDRHHIASFSGFFPASNPKIVITVVVDEPHLPGNVYGGSIAAPVFKEVALEVIRHLEISPVKPPENR